jgi:predicted transcriptional regulator
MNPDGKMTLSQIAELLECEVCLSPASMDISTALVLSSDMMSDVLAFAEPGALMITGLTSSQSVRTADFADAAAVLYIRGKRPDQTTLELAKELNIPVMCTKMGMFEVCGKLYSNGLRGIC